jgi:hypothetical protein
MLVMDDCVGVVIAAVVERMGGFGHLCNAYVHHPANMETVKALNSTAEQQPVLFSAPLRMLQDAKVGPEVVACPFSDACSH